MRLHAAEAHFVAVIAYAALKRRSSTVRPRLGQRVVADFRKTDFRKTMVRRVIQCGVLRHGFSGG
jgi:hypothetical protein